MNYKSIFFTICSLSLFSCLTHSDSIEVVDTFTTDSPSFTTWKKKENACYYAMATASRKAVKGCKKGKKGSIVKVSKGGGLVTALKKSCHSCEYKRNKEWKCIGSVTVQCKYTIEKPSSSLISKAKSLLLEQNKTENPCIKDQQTPECVAFRKNHTEAIGIGIRQ